MNAEMELLRTPECARRLGISRRTLYGWRYRKEVPSYKIGGVVYWRWDQIKDLVGGKSA